MRSRAKFFFVFILKVLANGTLIVQKLSWKAIKTNSSTWWGRSIHDEHILGKSGKIFKGNEKKFQTKWGKFLRKRTLKQSKEECPLSSPCPLCIPNILLLPVFLISIPSAYQYATISLKTSIFFGSFLIGGIGGSVPRRGIFCFVSSF